MIEFSDLNNYSTANRIIVIGDVHGDIKRLKNILINASIINNDLEWIANPPDTIVVQIGDQVDSLNRDPNIIEWEKLEDFNVLYFTNTLDNIAKTKGGRMISLIGNHELMNVIGNFSYVSTKSNFSSRYNYFMPKGILSPILAKRPLILKIGPLYFCHAGIRKHHIDILNKYNKDILYINDIWNKFMLTGQLNIEDKEIFDKIILDMEGILWTRNTDDDDILNEMFNYLECEYMFIGHTPVDNIMLLKNKIWYIDSCISRAFGSKKYQYIDITNNTISVKTINEN